MTPRVAMIGHTAASCGPQKPNEHNVNIVPRGLYYRVSPKLIEQNLPTFPGFPDNFILISSCFKRQKNSVVFFKEHEFSPELNTERHRQSPKCFISFKKKFGHTSEYSNKKKVFGSSTVANMRGVGHPQLCENKSQGDETE